MINQNQLLSKPDGNIMGLLQDPRLSATAVGAVIGAAVEKTAYTSNRAMFGVASRDSSGNVVYYRADSAGKATSTIDAKLGTNRQLLRLGIMVGAVACIEYVPDKSGLLQYGCLGAASVAAAHFIQEFFPALR
ncbi:hypothetical protein [Deinococcus roseus]|uniref:Uncharacterized protein n=1 Tax=Deinococcus roseus TaxID=392414 RepID=A0ABQ2DG59_9DEIO|nr:hypothetical protein [Deinococcus roseus]GGJ56577.1 hypothetical protein GCM10008938_48410 [Deinococcus roseus]